MMEFFKSLWAALQKAFAPKLQKPADVLPHPALTKPPSFGLANDPNVKDDIERFLSTRLEELIDIRITNKHGMTIFTRGPVEIMLAAADVLVGEKEDPPGSNRGPVISLIQDTVGGTEAYPWCMGFVQTCVAYAEKKSGIRSRIFPSEHCMSVWSASPKDMRCGLERGAIAIWNYPPGQSGHTGIVKEYSQDFMRLFEGNTTQGLRDDGAIERDGGGVHYTKRGLGSTAKMRLVGFIRPFQA
jgi:hypothetical protein